MKYVKPIAAGILMFVVSAIIIGLVLTYQWKKTVLTVAIEGEVYHFDLAKSVPDPRYESRITETVFRTEEGKSVKIVLTNNFYYDACDSYTVTAVSADGHSVVYSYAANQEIIQEINRANEGQNQLFIPQSALAKTFYYGDWDVTGFTHGASIESADSAVLLPAVPGGNVIAEKRDLNLSDSDYFVLDSITAFRNYLPFEEAITPIYIWTPVFVFFEYAILGVINIFKDIYRKLKKQKES